VGILLEVTGPWSDPDLIYLFGNPDPILLRSPDGGTTTQDIKPASGGPLKPVLSLPWREDDLVTITASGTVQYRDIDTWVNKGLAPIIPQCGMRSQYGGIQLLLGQKQAGEQYKVAFSGNLGEDWEDMSEGLPDMKVTSITGLEGSGVPEYIEPDVTTCPELEFELGRYWLRRLSGYFTPYFGWTWGPEFDDPDNAWYKELRDNRPWLGTQITHLFVKNCQPKDSDGYIFEIEVWVSSSIGLDSNAASHFLYFTECIDINDVRVGVYRYEDYANPQYELNWCSATNITKMSGTWSNGWFKILWKPFVSPSTLAGRCLYNASPYMPITIQLSSGQTFSYRRVDVTGEWGCDIVSTEITTGWFGERNYPDDYLTWQEEFKEKFDNKWNIGSLVKECVGDGINPYRSHLFNTTESGEPSFWYNWQHYDLGYGIIHIVGEE